VSGVVTSVTSLLFALALAAISVVPFAAKVNSALYLVCAVLLNAGLLYFAVQFLLKRNRTSARQLFFASIVFLPVLLGIMVFTKL
jgi:heme O synthase-like polyprenyltransferase